jgi:superfamily II DNA or RNA helicase
MHTLGAPPTPDSTDRGAASTAPEDLFTELFIQLYGVGKAAFLSPQHPVTDIYGASRFVDLALRARGEKIAFEIDGLPWHVPDVIPAAKYEDDLLRQNSLIHYGWRVFRWTDRQVAHEPERVKDQLALFLEHLPGLLAFDDFLPRQAGAVLQLREHQEDALLALERLRAEGKTIALLEHATGSGKTVKAITDARRLGGRTLWLVHRRDLVTQTRREFERLWPEVETGRYLGGAHETEAHNLVASLQSVAERLDEFGPREFGYVVMDEAHHAAADSYRRVLEHFEPRFLLGLTATAERADGQDLLELFRNCAHRLSLEEAVERGELVPIRCVRVKTNVDLSRVRYNQVQYHRKDIEEAIAIPARDRLIVDTYLQHVPGRKAVAFAVNVRHGEALAEEFRRADVAAQSVSGRMPQRERDAVLQAFHAGQVRVLCACDILNEGWDCPDIEVLLMARPTLSRVIYLQQLGRGTRKAPGKECLIVFDFVDAASRYNVALSAHRVLGKSSYRAGGLLLAPAALLAADEEALACGERPTTVLEIGVWAKEYEPIDVFNWQEALVDMVALPDLERELALSEHRLRAAVERGQVKPDHTLQLGERTHYYFHRDRAEEVRIALGAPKLDEHSLRDRFREFVEAMDMALSYKPVMLLALLDAADESGRAPLAEVVRRFQQFYRDRRSARLVVERPGSRKQPVDELDEGGVRRLMLEMPFEKFERRRFVRYDRDLAYVRIEPALWRQLALEDREQVRGLCLKAIESYYERFPAE